MSAGHATLKTPTELTIERSAHQRFHYDPKTGHLTGFDGRVLDIAGGSRAESAALIYFDKSPHLTPNQQWDYDAKTGLITSRMGTNWVLDIAGGDVNVKNDGQIILHHITGGNNQKWDIDEYGYIRSRVNPAFCIDVNGGPIAAKGVTKVSVYQCHLTPAAKELIPQLRASANQRWSYDAKTGVISGFDGRVLDVEGGSKEKGAKVIAYDRKPEGSESLNQQWDLKDGSFVTRMGTGFVIDVDDGKMADGTALILWTPNGDKNQKWDIDANGFIRTRANPKFVIDLNGGVAGKGLGKVTIYTGKM